MQEPIPSPVIPFLDFYQDPKNIGRGGNALVYKCRLRQIDDLGCGPYFVAIKFVADLQMIRDEVDQLKDVAHLDHQQTLHGAFPVKTEEFFSWVDSDTECKSFQELFPDRPKLVYGLVSSFIEGGRLFNQNRGSTPAELKNKLKSEFNILLPDGFCQEYREDWLNPPTSGVIWPTKHFFAHSLETRWELLLQLVRTIRQNHERETPRVHTDLSAGNVMVTEDDPPSLKVLDYGIKYSLGTEGWRAPEQAAHGQTTEEGQQIVIDTHTDIWTLGYWCLRLCPEYREHPEFRAVAASGLRYKAQLRPNARTLEKELLSFQKALQQREAKAKRRPFVLAAWALFIIAVTATYFLARHREPTFEELYLADNGRHLLEEQQKATQANGTNIKWHQDLYRISTDKRATKELRLNIAKAMACLYPPERTFPYTEYEDKKLDFVCTVPGFQWVMFEDGNILLVGRPTDLGLFTEIDYEIDFSTRMLTFIFQFQKNEHQETRKTTIHFPYTFTVPLEKGALHCMEGSLFRLFDFLNVMGKAWDVNTYTNFSVDDCIIKGQIVPNSPAHLWDALMEKLKIEKFGNVSTISYQHDELWLGYWLRYSDNPSITLNKIMEEISAIYKVKLRFNIEDQSAIPLSLSNVTISDIFILYSEIYKINLSIRDGYLEVNSAYIE